MHRFLTITAILETATGLALLAAPSLVIRLLFGDDIAGVSIILARAAGLALLCFGVACWPGRTGGNASALLAMLIYNTLVTLYLLFLGVGGKTVGPLIWPVVALHGALAVWCIACIAECRRQRTHMEMKQVDQPARDNRPGV